MDEEEEEMERTINNMTCDNPFQSRVTKTVQKKDAGWSLERGLDAGFWQKGLKISKDVVSNQTNRLM